MGYLPGVALWHLFLVSLHVVSCFKVVLNKTYAFVLIISVKILDNNKNIVLLSLKMKL